MRIVRYGWQWLRPPVAFRLRTLRDEAGLSHDVCVAGRGFKVRREDMRRLLQATDGKVFTQTSMHLLIDQTRSGSTGRDEDNGAA